MPGAGGHVQPGHRRTAQIRSTAHKRAGARAFDRLERVTGDGRVLRAGPGKVALADAVTDIEIGAGQRPWVDLVDERLLVPESLITEGMRRQFLDQGLVAEGAEAVGISALLRGGLVEPGAKIAVVISGRNVGKAALMEVLGKA